MALGCTSEGPTPAGVTVEQVPAVEQVPIAVPAQPAERPASAKPRAAERVEIDATWVAEGADLVLHVRPAALLATDEGRRVWRALGPAGDTARRALESAAGRPLEQIERVVVSVAAGASFGELAVTIATKPLADEAPFLSRTLEQLLGTSDAARTVTLLLNPAFLRGEGAAIIGPEGAPLRALFDAVVDDAWQGMAVSADLSPDQLRWELRVAPDVADPAVGVARGLADEARQWKAQAAGAIVGGVSDYAANVVGRLPPMLDVAARSARRSTEGEQAILAGVLPAKAAHNLTLAAELTAAELQGSRGAAAVAGPAPERPRDLAERFAAPVTIEFQRESLETALRILSDALGVPIEIAGRDLQLEGITRNQMLSLSVAGRSAEEALVELLRKANPDPLAEGPNDARQKLVYVVRESSPPTATKIVVTTRAAAALRKEELPPVFRP
jgi:hypothetical protein